MVPGPAFLNFWWNEQTRSPFLEHLSKEELVNLRLTCHDFSVRTASHLFKDVTVTFRASTFTKPVRMAALTRIGRHIRSLAFRMDHSTDTFLPPLLDPVTGEEKTFHYVPQARTSPLTSLKRPKYGSCEMSDLLIQQYGPIFHAATNVPAFVRAVREMPLLEHLTVSCSGQPTGQRYRRSVVDYALISLKMAIEAAPLLKLRELSLQPVHPAALFYLKPGMSLGCSPASTKKWQQIKKLQITLESWDFQTAGRDHLKHLHDYLLHFSPSLEHLNFKWKGLKGPCPFTLDTDVLVDEDASRDARKRKLRKMRLRRLKGMQLRNSRLHARQVDTFIRRHRKTLEDIDFDEVELLSGTWDDALAQLTELTGSEEWKAQSAEEPAMVLETDVEAEPTPSPCTSTASEGVRSVQSMESMASSQSSQSSQFSHSSHSSQSSIDSIPDALVLSTSTYNRQEYRLPIQQPTQAPVLFVLHQQLSDSPQYQQHQHHYQHQQQHQEQQQKTPLPASPPRNRRMASSPISKRGRLPSKHSSSVFDFALAPQSGESDLFFGMPEQMQEIWTHREE